MQLHVGAARNVNPPQFAALGPDSGFDAIGGEPSLGARLAAFLGSMEASGRLPKTLVYSLNPPTTRSFARPAAAFRPPDPRGRCRQGRGLVVQRHKAGAWRSSFPASPPSPSWPTSSA
jgi:glucuronate isomerase